MKNGVSIIFAVFVLLLLSVVAAAVFSLISTDTDTASLSVVSERAIGIAEGGVQFGAQAVQDDISSGAQTTAPASNGYCAITYLEGGYGGSYFGSSGVLNPEWACMNGTNWDTSSDTFYCNLGTEIDREIRVWNFQQRINCIGTRIKDARIVVRNKRSGSGSNPRVQLEYSTNGGITWTSLTPALTISSSSFSYDFRNFSVNPDFSNIMDSGNFMIRVLKINSSGREAHIDWLAMELTYEVDAPTEPWGSGSYATFPANLGNGTIQSVTMNDESAKINLNYASQTLLQRLLEYEGVPSGDAATISANIVTYRGASLTNPFNMIEELKQVTGMTDTYYNLVDQDITVHSWVNNRDERPTGSRAPVNINTASRDVLRAIFRMAISTTADVDSLADNIITQRAANPFTHFFSSYSQQNIDSTNSAKSFSYFLSQQAYLSASQMMDIREVCDGSLYNIVNGTTASFFSQTWGEYGTFSESSGIEFCYYSNVFRITSTGRSGGRDRVVSNIYGHIYNYANFSLSSIGTNKLPVVIGESPVRAYWRETR